MKDWKETLKQQINMAADEIKEAAFETLVVEDKLLTSARIIIELDPDAVANVRYEIDTAPRGILHNTTE